MNIPKGTPLYDLPETNRIREHAEWVRAALTTYATESGRTANMTAEDYEDPRAFFAELVSDFIGDLGHLSQLSGVGFRPVLENGLDYYFEESDEIEVEQLTEHAVRELAREIERLEQHGDLDALDGRES
ncbi:hypothetical protein ACQPW1_10265 [Nocardia sp. CA-128927]|uniref:hypothetical protein n=1 Tax=Nocardia sp. CA-128927 TaxID=3239975 RepID=UPI003D96D6C1